VKSTPYDRTERTFDLIAALIAFVVLAPVMIAVALAVAVALGRPVIFRQARAGLHGKHFSIYKFRTMLDVDESRGLVTDADRLPRFGRLLRATSLDELPALLNVIRGEMSLVGPRPLPVQYLDRYTEEQARRHLVRPGITGLAQVRGRNALSWDKKFELDLEWVENRSTTLYVRILRETAAVVIRRDGVAADGHATAPEFLGTPAKPLAPGRNKCDG
jgi:lipopolysaccharide/colanic/teichoic acid biosynthesis glycosyltransferase